MIIRSLAPLSRTSGKMSVQFRPVSISIKFLILYRVHHGVCIPYNEVQPIQNVVSRMSAQFVVAEIAYAMFSRPIRLYFILFFFYRCRCAYLAFEYNDDKVLNRTLVPRSIYRGRRTQCLFESRVFSFPLLFRLEFGRDGGIRNVNRT